MSDATFPTTGWFRKGYAPEQVDRFFSQARESYSEGGHSLDEADVLVVAFDPVRNGYDPAMVDAALERLAAAFVQQRRARIIAEEGEQAWLDRVYTQAYDLYPRLLRPAGERFELAHGWGYSVSEVDAFLNELGQYFDGQHPMKSTDIIRKKFTAKKNEKAYDETVVDSFLDLAATVLIAVE